MRLTALLPLLAAVPLFAFPAVATAAPGCFDAGVPLTVEEQRLTASLPAGGPAAGPELVRLAGFDPLVAEVKHDLCAARTPRRAERLVTQAGDRLWRTAVDRAQGRRPDLGTLDRFDDRPLYWARLQLSSAIRQWKPFPSQRDSLLSAFDRGSRGLDDVRFPPGKTRRVMVSGFDPFQLDGAGITISNPAGASALQLDGRVLDTPSGPAVVQAVSFPVVWGYFDQGIVEAAYGTALRDRARRPDVVLTISQGRPGRPGRFDVERWAGAWRGGFPDNNNASVTGGVPPAAELRLDRGHADPAAIATAAIVERAREISQSHHPDDDAVVHALAASLGRPAVTPDRLLQAWATDVKTQIGQHHREHLNALATLRRQQQLQEQRIANQRVVRAYLGDEVLTDVGSTVVWWLARNEEEVRETVDLIGTLARLSAAANNQEVDELFRHLVPENAAPRPAVPPPSFFTPPEPAFFVDAAGEVNPAAADRGTKVDLLPDPDDAQNSLFGHQLADLAERHGHSDLAQEYRERYRTVDATGPSGSAAPPEEQGGFFGHEPPSAEPPTGNGGAPSYPDAPDREAGSEDRRDWGAGG
uniref:Putative secreted protein n=1 Tax=Amycolatopsis orientalis subsp. vinearia TaxID=797057 RepID=D7RFM0_AMYOR|nr:putative secreted protein [Amycolatopsis orientalis subsp. vinearia]